MSDVAGINSVLSQIRAMREQMGAAGVAGPLGAGASPATAKAGGIGDAFTKVIDKVSQTQNEANAMAARFERGDKDASLVNVMLAMQKAQVSFKAVTEVRNRLVQAYQDIQNMPI